MLRVFNPEEMQVLLPSQFSRAAFFAVFDSSRVQTVISGKNSGDWDVEDLVAHAKCATTPFFQCIFVTFEQVRGLLCRHRHRREADESPAGIYTTATQPLFKICHVLSAAAAVGIF